MSLEDPQNDDERARCKVYVITIKGEGLINGVLHNTSEWWIWGVAAGQVAAQNMLERLEMSGTMEARAVDVSAASEATPPGPPDLPVRPPRRRQLAL